MKIALIAPTRMPARRANTIQLAKMAQALARNGHEVRLFAQPAEGILPTWDEFAHHYGLSQVFELDWITSRPAWRSYDFGWKSVQAAHRWGADLVLTRLPQAAAIASLRGIPVSFELHDLPQGSGQGLLRLFLAGRGARRLVLITRALHQALALRYPNLQNDPKVLIAPDGVDLERYTDKLSPLEARRRLAGQGFKLAETFTAGYSGHLYPGRGIELILELAARLPHVQFLIVGGEPADLQRVKDLAARQGLQNLTLAGFIANADLPLYQMACEVLLMPYQRRVAASSGGDIAAFLSPMKLFEYLACRRPIVCGDLLVLREVLNDENAILLPGDDLPAWEHALTRLEQDPDARRSLAEAAGLTAQGLSWEKRAERIVAASLAGNRN